MSRLIMVGLGLGVIVLLIALFFPTLISAPGGDLVDTVDLNESDSTILNDAFRLDLDDVNATEGTRNVTFRDIETQESVQTTVNESENETVELSGEPITVTLNSIVGDSEASLSVVYSATFGWSPGAISFADNLDIILMLLAFVLSAGFILEGVE